MSNQRTCALTTLMAVAISAVCAAPGHAQTRKEKVVPFQIVEATVDDIHAAFKSGKLTARQLVQGYLDRINAYDKAGRNINSVITINPNALDEADKLDNEQLAAYQVICLFQVPRPSTALWERLARYVKLGRGLAIVPGGKEMLRV